MNRWWPLALWGAAVWLVYAWFRYTSLPPADRWIVLGVLAAMVALAAVMLVGTRAWAAEGLGLFSLLLGVGGLMRLLSAPRFAWMPEFRQWELDLTRALLVVAAALLLPAAIRWTWVHRPGNGHGPPGWWVRLAKGGDGDE
jgi:hypothetical protein